MTSSSSRRHKPMSLLAEEEETTIKCVITGDGEVGKTSLALGYSNNIYPRDFAPTTFDTFIVNVLVDDLKVKVQLYDTAGQEDFEDLLSLCYPDTDVFLLCYSIANPTSLYNALIKWTPLIQTYSPGVPVILVGTKSDLRMDKDTLQTLLRQQQYPVSLEQADACMAEMGAVQSVECSALTQDNLKEVFDLAIVYALEHMDHSDYGAKPSSWRNKHGQKLYICQKCRRLNKKPSHWNCFKIW